MTIIEFKHIKPINIKTGKPLENPSFDPLLRFIKKDLMGNQLSFFVSQWATVTDKHTNLMWVNNWENINFPVREVTWFQSDDEYCQNNYEKTWNNGLNTENLIADINKKAWAGYTDWRVPTLQELTSLLLISPPSEIMPFDKRSYDTLFSEKFSENDKSAYFWSSFSDSYEWAFGVIFSEGYDIDSRKQTTNYLRAVRSI